MVDNNGVIFSEDGTILLNFPSDLPGVYRVPDGVEAIADYAFDFACITMVILPEGLRYLGTYAFDSCSQLCRVYLPASLESISQYGAFFECSPELTLYVPTGHTDRIRALHPDLAKIPFVEVPPEQLASLQKL